ncbi:hypothetical protein ACJX0J_041668, partial [Zea mays]
SSPPMDLEKSIPRVDPFGGVDVTLREGKLELGLWSFCAARRSALGLRFMVLLMHGSKVSRLQSLRTRAMGEKIIQNPHSHRASLNGDEMSCIGTIFLTCLDLLAEYITIEKCVVVREDKRLLTVLFPDGRDGRTFTLKAESSKDLFEWKTSLEEALAQAPNAALVMGHNGIFRNDTTDVYEEAIPNCWFPYSLHYHHVAVSQLEEYSETSGHLVHTKVNKVQTKKAPAPKIAKQESSDDDTSDETSESDEKPAAKPFAKNGSKTVKQESSSDEDSSEDESNDDSDDELVKKAAAKPLGVVAKNGLKKGKQETSSDETSSDDESDDDVKPAAPLKKTSVAIAQKKKGYSSESDSDDDSDEEVPPKSKAPAATIKKEDFSESESESDSEVEPRAPYVAVRAASLYALVYWQTEALDDVQ